jgi:hypothetical protein
MKIYFDKLYKDDRKKELCGLCVPFAKGCLKASDADAITILDGDRPLPVQAEVTSKWDDGSVRYVYLHFLADLPGNSRKELELVTSSDKKADYLKTIDIIEGSEGIDVSNEVISFSVKNASENLFDRFDYDGRSFDKEQFVGPFVTISGERLKTVFDKWRVVKNGKIFAVIEGEGRCLSADEKTFSGNGIRFEMRLSITAGKPWIDIGFRLINCTDGNIKPDDIVFAVKTEANSDINLMSPAVGNIKVDSTGCGDTRKTSVSGEIVTTTGIKELPRYDFGTEGSLQTGLIRTIAGKSNYRTEFKIATGGEQVDNTIIAEMLEKEANEHFAEVLYGTFFADCTDKAKDVGICATVFQAFQNFPKAVKADKDGVVIYILPDQNENSKVSKAEPVVFTSGMARETRFLLHLHDAAEPIYELDNRSLIYQMPDRPYIAPEEFAKAGVFPNVFLPEEKQDDDVEIALIEKADSHARCYGMLNFGDAPDPGYTAQGRGGGNLVWTNNEYDYPHAMYMMYARTGIRRFLDYANVAAWHWMDVDVCHYSSDPLRMGGQWEHTRKHTGGSEEGQGCKGEMVCSHEWVEGLLDLYHFTADERALSTAIGIGENVLGLLDTPMYQVPGEASARETGWALRTLTALYIETGDEKWTKKCEWIVSQFAAWNDRYGNWLAPYTDNTTIRVGFMISVALGSLMRYYRVFPSDELRQMMLEAIDDLTENFMTRQGLFYYKELPSLSRNGTNTLLLEAMAIGYELTGDAKYLDYGKKTFERSLNVSPASVGGKRIVEDAVLVWNGATKNFAQSFLPITCYYVQLALANKTVL